jgi:hypothetical protein
MWLYTTVTGMGAHLLPAPIPFMASSPSKGWLERDFPKRDMGSPLRWVFLRTGLGGGRPPLLRHGITTPIHGKLCALECKHVN